jgi:hypothetical protein
MNICGVLWHSSTQFVRIVILELNLLVLNAGIVGVAIVRKSSQKEIG